MRVVLVVVVAVTVTACSSVTTMPPAPSNAPTSTTSRSSTPAPTRTTTRFSAPAPTGDTGSSGLARADAICAQAIEAYQDRTAGGGVDPEADTLAAAQVLLTAATALAALPGADRPPLKGLAGAVAHHAAKEKALAEAMVDPSATSQHVNEAFEQLGVSGEDLAAASSGAPSCAAIKDRM
ncbi:hypothetical protein GCM10010492_06470 [Saccharothrix mutabilis subsp. mutabilis]|uniref:Lipoprotein n=1 Tax=Saccharothrix mutabilis subsp. mutabilis TaxID=66855 RepID=A0ABP3CNL7_9PSEU